MDQFRWGGSGDNIINVSGVTGSNPWSITGSAGKDTITGDAGADTIIAGGGNDIITGGAGADTVTGGAGNDTYVLGGSAGSAIASYVATNADTYKAFSVADDTVHVDISQSGATASHIDEVGTFLISSDAAITGTTAAAATASNVYVSATAPSDGTAFFATLNSATVFLEIAGSTTDGTAGDLVSTILNGAAEAVLGTSNAFNGFLINYTAGGDAQLWYHNDTGATGTGAISAKLDANDVRLVATFEDVTADALTNADFFFV